eukprot:scaffold363179_cov37-Prasinocladus_malaysianus.AAC.1
MIYIFGRFWYSQSYYSNSYGTIGSSLSEINTAYECEYGDLLSASVYYLQGVPAWYSYSYE